ncbi:OLC1v1003785C1 [Oldenlandia corymbosa var. corymbosa]|uniref:Carboxypeptidase n=1 Tax=Oldenlandia corymbosa var. corymbosa TaxID=529605 RepID=A0AAV1DD64_OLDCO|nr:OLC1v1003785C1 [Oldenlandia corymbosa var. corymbosa]
MADSSSQLFTHYSFPLFLPLLSAALLIASSSVNANSNIFPSRSTSRFLETRAEKLIRQLNLFPKLDVNVSPRYANFSDSSRLVEKRLHLDIHGDPGVSVEDFGHHAGYYKLPHTNDARMFYFFFESRNKKSDPVVIWLTGGPGCSSELALFYENGPFQIDDNLSLQWNNFGWDKVSNIIFVDQPTGTGFSFSSDQDDIRHDEDGVSNDMYDFLQVFFKKHPEYAANDFYITGESYAGHYIPALASRVHHGNKNKEGIFINLKGFAIGNGLTNPEIQYKSYTQYAVDMKLITQSDADGLIPMVAKCDEAIKLCEAKGEGACITAYGDCTRIFEIILQIAGNINYYDIRKQCGGSKCYDFSNMEKFLNDKKVRDALGVGDMAFVSCSTVVYRAMIKDWMKNLEVKIPELLEDGIRGLLYAGEFDLICNWLGNWNWVHAMEWSGQKDFVGAPESPFVVDGKEAGLQKNYGPLTFLKVHDAGHMVPMDQPKAALEMLQKWMQGSLPLANKLSPQHRAARLIRGFNLFPKHDININLANNSGLPAANNIVEKRLQLTVHGNSGATVKDLAQHAGYFRLPNTKDARMFYFFFESRQNKSDPVVIWLTGGPGCSGELALFSENGPFHITPNLSLVWNDFGWDKASNLIYVDQPTGTGFSYSSSEDDVRHDSTASSNDLYNFLQAFFKQHPEFASRDFYITGESYAGHYIPALATRIQQGNKNKEGKFINLKGFAIGNGLTEPGIQYQSYPDYALDAKLITKSDYDSLNETVAECLKASQSCGTNGQSTCTNALQICEEIFNDIMFIADGVNYYDVRKQCEGPLCYDFSNIENFLNQPSVRSALGVGNIEFVSCSTTVNQEMTIDHMRNYEPQIPPLLESGIRALIYVGEYDFICNWIGNSRWVETMKWSGQRKYLAAPNVPFTVDGVEAGVQRKNGPLIFLKVHNAGHLVPMDQPKASLEMLQRWLKGSL